MPDTLFNEKVSLLRLYFPEVDASVLGELLKSCNGSIEDTKSLVSGTASRKRKLGILHQGLISPVAPPSRMVKRAHSEESGSSNKPRSSGKVITIHTPQQVKQLLSPYVSMYRNFLTKEDAEGLLLSIHNQRHKINNKQFYLFDNLCTSNHGLAYFHNKKLNDRDYHYNGTNAKLEDKTYDASLIEVSEVVNKFMNETVIPSCERLPYQSKEPWNGSSCVVNYYEKLSNNLDWHSDRLNYIGAHNFIALVSLGSTRYFRLKKNYGSNIITYQIPLTHNTLLIMHAGCQEEYRHCVNPMLKPEQAHPLVGQSRYNLTFRFHPLEFNQSAPKCKCNIAMTLRRSFKNVESRGRYFWSCENVYRNMDCGDFFWADLDNPENNFKTDDAGKCSCWVAADDDEKWEYLKKKQHPESPKQSGKDAEKCDPTKQQDFQLKIY